jgi:hypothetical protein
MAQAEESEGGATPPAGPAHPTPPEGPPAAAVKEKEGASRRTLGIRAVIAAAVVTAIAGSIFNTDVYAAAWRAITGGKPSQTPVVDGSTNSSLPPATIKLTSRTSPNRSITFKAPSTWASRTAPYNVFGSKSSGDAFKAGANIDAPPSMSLPRLYVAASGHDARRLDLSPSSAPAALKKELRATDWTRQGCVLVSETALSLGTVSGQQREWQDCYGIEGAVMWEAFGITSDARALVYIQFNILTADIPRDVAEQMARSIAVDDDRLSDMAAGDKETG